MNLEEAKKTLKDVSQSTATKNPKMMYLILELCSVIEYLLEQVDVIDLCDLGHQPEKYGPRPPSPRPWLNEPNPGLPEHTPPIIDPSRLPFRKGNAGDAE